MKYLKIIGVAICVVVMSKACQMEYACNVVDSIPCEIRERIIEENPECVNIDVLAEYWIANGDSLVAEIEAEQEYERELEEYLSNHPEDNWD